MDFPDPPRGRLDEQALGHWFTLVRNWARDLQSRVGTLEGVEPAAAVEVPDDGTGYASFAHVSGNAGLAAHWNVAGMVAGNGLTTYYSPAANTFYAVPFVAPKRGGSVIALAYDSNVATGNSRVALYTNTGPETLYPATLLGETGSKANTAAATVVSTTGLSLGPLTPGELYWLAYVNDNAAASVRKLDPGACSGLLGAPLAQTSTPPGIKVAFTYAAPPATFPAGGGVHQHQFGLRPGAGLSGGRVTGLRHGFADDGSRRGRAEVGPAAHGGRLGLLCPRLREDLHPLQQCPGDLGGNPSILARRGRGSRRRVSGGGHVDGRRLFRRDDNRRRGDLLARLLRQRFVPPFHDLAAVHGGAARDQGEQEQVAHGLVFRPGVGGYEGHRLPAPVRGNGDLSQVALVVVAAVVSQVGRVTPQEPRQQKPSHERMLRTVRSGAQAARPFSEVA